MTDFTWYSRLMVWVGALVLLIESVTMRPYGLITLLAVIMLAAGLVGFVGGLAFEGRPSLIWDMGLPEVQTSSVVPPVLEDAAVPETSSVVAEAGPLEPQFEPPVTPTRSEAAVEPALPFVAAAPPRTRSGATAVELAPNDASIGRPCFSCHEPMKAGQTAAICPECGGVHHATCWVGNHFHCGREGCGGHGSLQAPDA